MAQDSNAKAAGRRAGFAYLVVILFSIAGYAPMTRLLAGDPQIVLGHLAADHALFSLAFAAMGIGFAAWIVLGLMLYRLMSSAGRLLGLLMLVFTVAGVAMNLIALSQLFPLVGLASPSMDAGALAPIVHRYERLLLLAQIFSGLWLFPFGWLVLRSHIVPRLLGFCLIVAGFFYLLQFATAFSPDLDQMIAYRIVSTATGVAVMIGEFAMCLWLLIKGAREPKLDRAV
jgi:hypothetical protein